MQTPFEHVEESQRLFQKHIHWTVIAILVAMSGLILANILYGFGVPWWPVRASMDLILGAVAPICLIIVIIRHHTGGAPFVAVIAGLLALALHETLSLTTVENWILATTSIHPTTYERALLDSTIDSVLCLIVLSLSTSFILTSWQTTLAASRESRLQLALAEIQAQYGIVSNLVTSYERDRKLTALDLHDGLAQYVVSAQLHALAAQRLVNDKPIGDCAQVIRQKQENVIELLQSASNEARRLINGLRPPILDESGIVAAIDYLVHEYRSNDQLDVEFSHSLADERYDALLETTILRVVQESLANVSKHAKTRCAHVDLVQKGSEITIAIRDDGVGFDVDQTPAGRVGLQSVRERARILGGKATIESCAAKGTVIRAVIPARPPHLNTAG